MNNNDVKNNISSLIGKGKTDQALDVFMQWAAQNDADLMRDLTGLKSRMSSLKRNENLGLMNFSETSMQRNQITNALLSLLNDADMGENSKNQTKYSSLETPPYSPPTPRPTGNRLKVFYSYAHNDKDYLQNLQTQLRILERTGKIESWSDAQILPGERWSDKIMKNLIAADIILLLVSADFLNSDYIWTHEFEVAMERERAGKAAIVPIILKKCLWRETELKELQAIPHDDNGRLRPVAEWGDRDKAFAHIAEDLVNLINSRIKK